MSASHDGHYKVGRPYTINGTTYAPYEDFDYVAVGEASWYGPGFHGRPTANGERYDMHALTAAHPTLQLPSIARVTNLENGRSVVVRVNDRGPFRYDRLIDLSRGAAEALDMVNQGFAQVRVELLTEESLQLADAMGRNGPRPNVTPQRPATPEREVTPEPRTEIAVASRAPSPATVRTATPAPAAARSPAPAPAETVVASAAPIGQVTATPISPAAPASPPPASPQPAGLAAANPTAAWASAPAVPLPPPQPAAVEPATTQPAMTQPAMAQPAPTPSPAPQIAVTPPPRPAAPAPASAPADDTSSDLPFRTAASYEPADSPIYVEAGPYTLYDNAALAVGEMSAFGPSEVESETVGGVTLYTARLGPFGSSSDAAYALDMVQRGGLQDIRVIQN